MSSVADTESVGYAEKVPRLVPSPGIGHEWLGKKDRSLRVSYHIFPPKRIKSKRLKLARGKAEIK
jgi:hypothetical protein